MKDMKNGQLEKAFKNIAKTAGEGRPSLQCLHVDKAGYAVVTDSHRLLRIDNYKDDSEDTTEYNLNLLNFKLCNDLNYPETERLIPTMFKFEWSFNHAGIETLATFFKPFKVTVPLPARNSIMERRFAESFTSVLVRLPFRLVPISSCIVLRTSFGNRKFLAG